MWSFEPATKQLRFMAGISCSNSRSQTAAVWPSSHMFNIRFPKVRAPTLMNLTPFNLKKQIVIQTKHGFKRHTWIRKTCVTTSCDSVTACTEKLKFTNGNGQGSNFFWILSIRHIHWRPLCSLRGWLWPDMSSYLKSPCCTQHAHYCWWTKSG